MDDPGTPTSTLRELDRLLHPRTPLLARASPNSELLSLYRTEESLEEQEIRESLHLGVVPSAGRTEIMGGKHQLSMPASTSAHLPFPPKLETQPNTNEPKTPALAPSSLTYPQATTPDLRPDITPASASNVSPPTQNLGQGSSNSSDTLRPQQEQGTPPSLMSEVAPEESRLGIVSEVINVVEDDDDDDDEEMPTIDMESDSD